MRERLFNFYLILRAYWRWIFRYNEGEEDSIPKDYVEEDFYISHDGHAWGKYHPKYPYQYWDAMFVHRNATTGRSRRKISSGNNAEYTLESRFSPKKFDEYLIHYGIGVMITTTPFKYGYFTCRMKFPKASGQWPAFWMYNGANDRYSEIDIVEAYSKSGNYRSYTKFQPNIHYIKDGKWINTGAVSIPIPLWNRDYVKFSMLWEEGKIDIFYDGYLVKRYTNKEILSRMDEMYLVINAGVEEKEYKSIFAELKVKNIGIFSKIIK